MYVYDFSRLLSRIIWNPFFICNLLINIQSWYPSHVSLSHYLDNFFIYIMSMFNRIDTC